ncbi:hypothetical protein V5799_024797, partial [Amblyomma americanum]
MDNDPLNYNGSLRAGYAAAMVQALKRAHARADAVQIPLLILHGSGDKNCDPDASRDFFDKVSGGDKTLKVGFLFLYRR